VLIYKYRVHWWRQNPCKVLKYGVDARFNEIEHWYVSTAWGEEVNRSEAEILGQPEKAKGQDQPLASAGATALKGFLDELST
jgi:hypothetical protein